MTTRPIERCPISWVIRVMQIETRTKRNYIPIRMAKIEHRIKALAKMYNNCNFYQSLIRMQSGTATLLKSGSFFYKLKHTNYHMTQRF